MLNTMDLKYQMVERRTEKLTERFISPYKIKKIVSSNIVELELPSTIKIYSVVNVSRIQKYVRQVEGQRKDQLAPVIIEREEEQCYQQTVIVLSDYPRWMFKKNSIEFPVIFYILLILLLHGLCIKVSQLHIFPEYSTIT